MRRRIEGLHDADQSSAGLFPDGLFLVRVDRAQYRWRAQKPHYALRLEVLEPKELAGHLIAGRLYCTPKALWKLNWFLHDFGYDVELLERDEIDEKALIGLRGLVKIGHFVLDGTLPCSISTASPQPASGKNSPLPRRRMLAAPGWRHDLQLHPDQPLPHMPSTLSASLP